MMDKISISNILSIPENEVIGEFGTGTLYNNKKTVQMEVDELLKLKRVRRENKIKLYRGALRECIRMIKNADAIRKTEMLFKINRIEFGFPEYDKDECRDYVIAELRKYDFDVTKIDNLTIFVSWEFLEFQSK